MANPTDSGQPPEAAPIRIGLLFALPNGLALSCLAARTMMPRSEAGRVIGPAAG